MLRWSAVGHLKKQPKIMRAGKKGIWGMCWWNSVEKLAIKLFASFLTYTTLTEKNSLVWL